MTLEEIYKLPSRIYKDRVICNFGGMGVKRAHLVVKYVMGIELNSKLFDVHHKDKNSINDLPNNLELLLRKEHVSLHTKGRKVSEEVKEKLRQYNLGKKLSEEHKKKMSDAQKGKVFTEEHKIKLSESHKGLRNNLGHKRSEETKKRMSEVHKGVVFSEEHKRKLSESKKGKSNPSYGKHPSEEIKIKMSEAQKLRFKNKKKYGK